MGDQQDLQACVILGQNSLGDVEQKQELGEERNDAKFLTVNEFVHYFVNV